MREQLEREMRDVRGRRREEEGDGRLREGLRGCLEGNFEMLRVELGEAVAGRTQKQ